MNADRELARMWLSEMWRAVPEFHPSIAEQARVVARNEVLAASRESGAEPKRRVS